MQPSKGLWSTEFWMFAATGILLVLNGTTLINIPPDQVTAWMAMTGLYGTLRTGEKSVAHWGAAKSKETANGQA